MIGSQKVPVKKRVQSESVLKRFQAGTGSRCPILPTPTAERRLSVNLPSASCFSLWASQNNAQPYLLEKKSNNLENTLFYVTDYLCCGQVWVIVMRRFIPQKNIKPPLLLHVWEMSLCQRHAWCNHWEKASPPNTWGWGTAVYVLLRFSGANPHFKW